jgi:hypothetical protein
LSSFREAGGPAFPSSLPHKLDEAVFAAYGSPSNFTTQQILANLLALNHQRATAAESKPVPPKSRTT